MFIFFFQVFSLYIEEELIIFRLELNLWSVQIHINLVAKNCCGLKFF